MAQVTPYVFDDQPVRTIQLNGEPWFVAVDVCAAIKIKNTANAVVPLDDDEKADLGLTDISSTGVEQTRQFIIISESGLYTLILRSRKATTQGTVQHRFRRWITSEVLPAIRKTGGYNVSTGVAAPLVDPGHRYSVRDAIVRPDGQWGRVWAIPVYRIDGQEYWNVHVVLDAYCGLDHVPDGVKPHENARNLMKLHPELIGAGTLWVAIPDRLARIICLAGGCWDNRVSAFMAQIAASTAEVSATMAETSAITHAGLSNRLARC